MVAFFALACAPDGEVEPTPSPASVRVLVLNIEYGGLVVDFQAVADAVTAADADVVAVNEALLSLDALAAAVGFTGADPRTDIIGRFPVLAPPDGGGRWSWVEVAPGRGFALGNTHLPSDPYGPYLAERGATVEEILAMEHETRVPALQPFLDVLGPLAADGVPVLLGGDFNSPSHLDWTAEAVGSRPHLRFPVAWPVTVAAADAGLVDVFRAAHPDPVAVPGLTWWAARPPDASGDPDPDDPQDRIDLLLAGGPVQVVDVEVVGETGGPGVDIALAPWGTDHRGVVATLEVELAALPPLVTVADRLAAPGEPVFVRYHGADGDVLEASLPDRPPAATATIDGADGSWELDTTGWPLGAYHARLVRSGAVLAAYPFVLSVDPDAVALTTDAATYGVGQPVAVSWQNGRGNRWDWLGVYRAPADPLVDGALGYAYTGSEVEGTVVFDADTPWWPLGAGDYEVYYLLNDGYVSAGAEVAFTVR